ncbi:MAG: hypothetical protein GF401_09360 [Chitinivibrionales bacterium]|nr:hypothetical protein [Chitinivibrionales bacterium]
MVTWEATAGDNNSKRNDPKTGLKNPADNKLVEFKDKKAKTETKVKNGKSECVLACGLAGGDEFSISTIIQVLLVVSMN